MGRLAAPAQALAGALALVALLTSSDSGGSPAQIIGETLSDGLADGWVALAPFLGALGSFFSGSTTVSNLTFSAIHFQAAVNIGINPARLLAVQNVGAALGNMVCIANILAARSVLNVTEEQEGYFIKRTAKTALVYAVMTAALGAVFIYA